MIFNHIISHLKRWCIQKAEAYRRACEKSGGVAFVGYQAADELEFKLSTLLDRSFEGVEELREEILGLLPVHYEPSVLNPQNRPASHIIDRTNQEFCVFLEEVLSRKDPFPPAEIPYKRVIVGTEAAALKDRFRARWGYVNTSCWFPLIGDEPKEIPEKFFVMFDDFEPYQKQFERIIGLPQAHLFCYGESGFRPEHCLETAELTEYCGTETMYTDKAFSWAIYFSHENTVSFAGAIVPQIKELLAAEKARWNRFEWEL